MASRDNQESTPESSNSLPRMFYCYECRARTSPDAEHIQNFTCMQCNSGFIEDITVREDSPSSNSDDQSYEDLDPMIGETIGSLLEGLHGLERESSRSDSSERGRRSGRPRAPPHMMTPSDQFIQSLLANLIGGRGGMPPGSIHIATTSGGGGMPGFFTLGSGPGGGPVPMMPLYGNPGDYAWGRGGLDAIVTQLLNQMEGTGPPPMNDDEIKKIPTIKIDQSHIDAKAQCSVCWDDFKLEEDVRQLKCDHIFHENCIIPWLELHNTCPVCRKEQEDVPKEAAGSEAAAGAGSGVSVSFDPSSASANAATLTGMNPSTSTSSASGQQVHTGTVRAAEQLAATLGSTISVFNQFFGVPSQGPPPHLPSTAPASSASMTSANSTSTASSSSTTSSATSTSTSSSSPSSSSQSRSNRGGQGGNNDASGFQDMDLE